MRTLILGLIASFLISAQSRGQSGAPFVRIAHQMVGQTFEIWRHASAANASSFFHGQPIGVRNNRSSRQKTAANKRAMKAYLDKLIPAMQPSSKVAHIPLEAAVVPTKEPGKYWTGYYERARMQLRPNITYLWVSNATRGNSEIELSKSHVRAIRDNFSIVMWYRNALDGLESSDSGAEARHFQKFLDHFVNDFRAGLPASPRVNIAKGKTARATWKVDERSMREQLVVTYRYLDAKYRTYPEYEQFVEADAQLFEAMMKIAYLSGVRLRLDWFDNRDIPLSDRSGWRQAMAATMSTLPRGSESASSTYSPVIVQVPARKPVPVKKSSKPSSNHDTVKRIEIVLKNS